MNKVDKAWGIFYGLQRQFPLWPSTFSTCGCGRADARGSGKCAICIEEDLAKMVGKDLAAEAVAAMKSVQDVWARIAERAEAQNVAVSGTEKRSFDGSA